MAKSKYRNGQKVKMWFGNKLVTGVIIERLPGKQYSVGINGFIYTVDEKALVKEMER